MKVYKSYKTAKRQPQSVNSEASTTEGVNHEGVNRHRRQPRSVNSEASTTEGVNHAVPWVQKKSLTSEAFL